MSDDDSHLGDFIENRRPGAVGRGLAWFHARDVVKECARLSYTRVWVRAFRYRNELTRPWAGKQFDVTANAFAK